MKKLFYSAAAILLATATTIPVALADGPRASSSNAIAGTAETAAPSTAAAPPRYQWQYHYAGGHARWVGYWALAK